MTTREDLFQESPGYTRHMWVRPPYDDRMNDKVIKGANGMEIHFILVADDKMSAVDWALGTGLMADAIEDVRWPDVGSPGKPHYSGHPGYDLTRHGTYQPYGKAINFHSAKPFSHESETSLNCNLLALDMPCYNDGSFLTEFLVTELVTNGSNGVFTVMQAQLEEWLGGVMFQ